MRHLANSRLVRSRQVKATFFLNGLTAEENVDAVKELVAKGHELAAQPYIHEYTVTLDKEGERKTIQGSIDAFKKVAGVKPLGYLSPGVRPTPNTIDLISEMGFTWSSDGIDDDVPYALGPKDKSIVMMPKDFHPNDYTTYETGSRSPRELYQPAGRSIRLSVRGGRHQPEGDERDDAPVPGRASLSRENIIRTSSATRARIPNVWFAARYRYRRLVARVTTCE